MNKHTPAPWKVDRLPNRRVYQPDDVEIIDDRDQVIATLYKDNRGTVGEDAANARLIAAAPELYALALRVAGDDRAAYTYEDAAQTARALLAQIDGTPNPERHA